ncbi:methyltransferase domain-containing protein [Cereibacter sphaeroides]|uniref:tRNA1(Val) (adenine(37)-N6)-methyltransferase n=1 Tax=Cereibacter sphaeroides TaxID=1063 RepID=UPI000F53DCDE|nr:methyltransferase [Cereibacter sphaeroides]AZB62829.1 methyltransferase domain-containing protein [Cereibacter sphaeroides]AZB69214.1 methyltransferase domain-containing protein [Cereibacter sphaeroides]
MFAPDELTSDGFLGGRLTVLQPRRGYRAATDPVLLAAAVPASAGQSVLELGCGAGVASLCLAARVPGLRLAGLELQPAYAALARENAAMNGVALEVVEGDLSAMPAVLRRSFHHVIANPPYYPAGGGTGAADPGRERAMREETPLALWIEAAVRRLAPRGVLSLIFGADRLPDALAALDGRMGSSVLLPLQPREGRPAKRVILQSRKGGRAPFRLLPPFVLHEGAQHDGDRESFSPAAAHILRNGGEFPFRLM